MPLFSTPSPKDLALATWRDVQRPQYIAKIKQANRKEKGLRDPKISDPRK